MKKTQAKKVQSKKNNRICVRRANIAQGVGCDCVGGSVCVWIYSGRNNGHAGQGATGN